MINERINEHGYRDKDSVIYNHSTNCKGVNYFVDLLRININSTEHGKLDRKIFGVNIVKENTFLLLMKPDDGTIYYLKKHQR